MMTNPTLVILSGGLDSTVLAYYIARQGNLKGCVSVNYGQRHNRELECAAKTCNWLGVPHHVLDLHTLRNHLSASSLTSDQPVPEGHYAEDTMKATVVPNRNMILISLAVGVAITQGCKQVAYGAHAGDHAIYPDCRPAFADALSRTIDLCDWKPPVLVRPFIDITKAEIVGIGIRHGVNFQHTHTCYNGHEVACGKCGTCVERLEAFALNDYRDPVEYLDQDYWRTVVGAAPRPSTLPGLQP